ncbi:MAG: anaerobic ribonucleoside-triphosphate reductase activating protein [Alphaproteobacteria bacterium]|nr:anaerobic ribonucleoside-triphosphate reductase activating protein [Alphaproteobacteria bacterium]
MSEILVGGVETFSTVDFPGYLAAVVFMQGCPWRCPFCYNQVIQKIGQPTGFLWPKFLEFLRTRQGKLDAVVFSGGEPLVQDGLAHAISEVKELGFKVGLHTGGYRPEHLAKIIPLVDWVGLDIKAPFVETRYQDVTKTNHLDKVMQSLSLLVESGIDFECRTTCDPRILSVEDIYAIAQDLKSKGVKKYFLQQYRPIEGDVVTTDADRNKFFQDQDLLNTLKSSFVEFNIRK